jgi:hypothetical protein
MFFSLEMKSPHPNISGCGQEQHISDQKVGLSFQTPFLRWLTHNKKTPCQPNNAHKGVDQEGKCRQSNVRRGGGPRIQGGESIDELLRYILHLVRFYRLIRGRCIIHTKCEQQKYPTRSRDTFLLFAIRDQSEREYEGNCFLRRKRGTSPKLGQFQFVAFACNARTILKEGCS